jgi:hypothetical protein
MLEVRDGLRNREESIVVGMVARAKRHPKPNNTCPNVRVEPHVCEPVGSGRAPAAARGFDN